MATKQTKTTERNGVKRPVRGIALQIWETLERIPKGEVSFKSLAFVAAGLEVNERTLAQQVWRFRKFHGLA